MSKFESIDAYLDYMFKVIATFRSLTNNEGNALEIEKATKLVVPEATLCLSVSYRSYSGTNTTQTVYISRDAMMLYQNISLVTDSRLFDNVMEEYKLAVDYLGDAYLEDMAKSILDDIYDVSNISLSIKAKIHHDDSYAVVFMDSYKDDEAGRDVAASESETLKSFLDFMTDTPNDK